MEEMEKKQIVLTVEQSKEIRKTGKCDLKRTFNKFPFVFHLVRAENGKVEIAGVECDTSRYEWDIVERY